MRCYKPAPCSLSSCMQNRYLPPRCSIAPGDVSVGSGRGVDPLVRRAEFWVLVVAVVVWCRWCRWCRWCVQGRCWAALFHGSQRCTAAAMLALSGPIACIIVSHHHPKTAHSRVGSAVSVVPCLQGLSRRSHFAGLAWPGLSGCPGERESFSPHRPPPVRHSRAPLTIARTLRKGAPSAAHLTPALRTSVHRWNIRPSPRAPYLALHAWDRSSRPALQSPSWRTDCLR